LARRCRKGAIHPIIRSPRRRGRAASANIDPERLGGPEVDDKLELGRLLDSNVGCQIKLDQLRFI
jgi:hypothetical protein